MSNGVTVGKGLMPRPGIHENGSVGKFIAENSIQALIILLDFILPQAFRVSTTILDCSTIAS
jgi:hypothetical protein